MPNPTIQFDFRNYVPDQSLGAGTFTLESKDCVSDTLIITLLAKNLIPGHIYKTTYTLLNPSENTCIDAGTFFNPSSSDLYASSSSQNLATTAKIKCSGRYVISATIIDMTEGFGQTGSSQTVLQCGTNDASFFVEIIDSDIESPIDSTDDIIKLGLCDNPLPLIGLIKNAERGKAYKYRFYDNPVNSIAFENQSGIIYAGDNTQNFNSKIALSGNPYAFVYAEVQDLDTKIIKNSQPVLLQCYQTNPCSVVLPTGVNVSYGIPTYKECRPMGCTAASLVKLNGGSNFTVGDKVAFGGGSAPCIVQIDKVGIGYESIKTFGGGSGIKVGTMLTLGGGSLIKVQSVGLTNDSVNSLTSCGGFGVGDLLTTVGGDGDGVIIKVLATGLNGSISSFNVLNGGYGFTYAPTGVKAITGNGSCASASFNMNNGTIPYAGGLTNDSFSIYGGIGYQFGQILRVDGQGGEGAKVEVISLSLTQNSISLSGGSGYTVGDYVTTSGCGGKDALIKITSVSSGGAILDWEVENGGYDFECVPTALIRLSGNGSGGSITGSNCCWALPSEGGITKESISGIIGDGPGYTVGEKIYLQGGGGSGGIIVVTKVDANGNILDFAIEGSGCCYTSTPLFFDENGATIVPTPTINFSKLIENPIVVIDSGSGYGDANNPLVIRDDATGTIIANPGLTILDFTQNIPLGPNGPIVIINAGSFPPPDSPISPPEPIPSDLNICCIETSYTQPLRGSIVCSGSITKDVVSNLIGKSGFALNEKIYVESANGGNGAGGVIQVTAVSGNIITDFVVYNGGCYYSDPIALRKSNGSIITNVIIDYDALTGSPITVIDPGDIKGNGCTSCCETITGYGICPDPEDIVFFDHLQPDYGPPRTPTPTPTVSLTPSPTPPVLCNDIQSAGGQNVTSITKIINAAVAGQNYLIIKDVDGLSKNTVVNADGIPAGTYITEIINWFSDFDNRVVNKKIFLSNAITKNISTNTDLNLYFVDIRLIQVPYWPGVMTFDYDAYSVPDRFLVFAVPLDSRLNDVLLFDSRYRGAATCGYADSISGTGRGSVNLNKPDGCTYIKVIVEAPCEGTAWEYALSCPQRTFTTVSSTPTVTPTITPTPSSLP